VSIIDEGTVNRVEVEIVHKENHISTFECRQAQESFQVVVVVLAEEEEAEWTS
jgi:hypothetical protein